MTQPQVIFNAVIKDCVNGSVHQLTVETFPEKQLVKLDGEILDTKNPVAESVLMVLAEWEDHYEGLWAKTRSARENAEMPVREG